MCEFCETENENTALIKEIGDCYLEIVDGNSLHLCVREVEVSQGLEMFNNIYRKINYCPECGRRLK